MALFHFNIQSFQIPPFSRCFHASDLYVQAVMQERLANMELSYYTC